MKLWLPVDKHYQKQQHLIAHYLTAAVAVPCRLVPVPFPRAGKLLPAGGSAPIVTAPAAAPDGAALGSHQGCPVSGSFPTTSYKLLGQRASKRSPQQHCPNLY